MFDVRRRQLTALFGSAAASWLVGITLVSGGVGYVAGCENQD
jgi:hypothetical protein